MKTRFALIMMSALWLCVASVNADGLSVASPLGVTSNLTAKVVSIDSLAQTMEVSVNGETKLLVFDDKYRIKKHRWEAIVSSFKVGDSCVCIGVPREDGSFSLRSVVRSDWKGTVTNAPPPADSPTVPGSSP